VVRSKNATILFSSKTACLLTKKKKPFQDGELLNEGFLIGGDCLFEGVSNKPDIMPAK
jgi:hypothetical protein